MALAAVQEARGRAKERERALRQALGVLGPTQLDAQRAKVAAELGRHLVASGHPAEAVELYALARAVYADPLAKRRLAAIPHLITAPARRSARRQARRAR